MTFENLSKTKKILAFISVVSAVCLLYTDQSILPVALPTIQKQFHSTELQLHWMINAYFLAIAITVLAAGKFSDLFGHRKIFTLGLAVFAITSLICALSLNSFMLIVFRFIQGIGAALMIPSSFTLLLDMFPHNKRGFAVGINVSVGSFFLAIAPYIGGFFTQYLSWRWVFGINLPICIIGLIFAWVAIPKSQKYNKKFDVVGFITFVFGIICLMLVFMQGKEWGWTSPAILLLFIFALIFLALLYFADKKTTHGFVNFKLFKCRLFFNSSFVIFIGQVVGSVSIFWAIYLQMLLNFSPVKSGLVLLIVAVPMIVMGPLSGKLMDKFSAKVPIVSGMILISFSFIWLTIFFNTANIWLWLPSLLTYGSGYSFLIGPAFANGANVIEYKSRGMATGVLSTFRSCGITLGVAIMGTILVNLQNGLFARALKNNSATTSLDPAIYEGLLSKTQKSLEALSKLSSSNQEIVQNIFHKAATFSFLSANIFAAVVIIISLIIYLFLSRSKSR